MSKEEDRLTRYRALLDQNAAQVADLAPSMFEMYESFCDAGFSDEQAYCFVFDWWQRVGMS